MLFNSLEFIFVFLPVVWCIDRLLLKYKSSQFSRFFLVVASFFFYGYYNPFYIILLGGSIIANYLVSLCLEKTQADLKLNKIVLSIGLVFNLGLLFYFKYFNFFLDNCRYILHVEWSIEKIALPLGISFFTFQQISFIVDRYWKKAEHYNFWDYACFVSFFPQLVAGPIVLHKEFIPQLQKRTYHIDQDMLFKGMALFIIGLAKKVLIADNLALMANAVFDNWIIRTYYIDFPTGIIAAFVYFFELYFDFSGYSDMARGLGKMFGMELPVNFNSPLMSESVGEFWNRWHMTLNVWLRQYIYIPLGGNRKGKFRKHVNVFLVFLISGIWHGANWTFVIWGMLQGIAVIFEDIVKKRLPYKWMRILVTNIYVALSFVFFRSESVAIALQLLKRSFTVKPGVYIMRLGKNLEIAENYVFVKMLTMKFPNLMEPFFMLLMFAFLGLCVHFIRKPNADARVNQENWGKARVIRLGIIFLWVIISLSSVSTFLYFNF